MEGCEPVIGDQRERDSFFEDKVAPSVMARDERFHSLACLPLGFRAGCAVASMHLVQKPREGTPRLG